MTTSRSASTPGPGGTPGRGSAPGPGSTPGRGSAPGPGSAPDAPALVVGDVIDGYISEIAPRLPGRSRARADIIAELRSGLLDAADAHESAGLPPDKAFLAATAEFGVPERVAAAFRAELAAGQARRVGAALLATGPLVGLLWIVTAVSSHISVGFAPPWRWTGQAAALSALLPLVAVAVGVTAWAGIASIAATGRLTRWLPDRPRRAPTAAAIAGFGAVGADGLGLLLLAAQLIAAPGTLSLAPASAAAAASVVRILLARRAACRCLETRASLA